MLSCATAWSHPVHPLFSAPFFSVCRRTVYDCQPKKMCGRQACSDMKGNDQPWRREKEVLMEERVDKDSYAIDDELKLSRFIQSSITDCKEGSML